MAVQLRLDEGLALPSDLHLGDFRSMACPDDAAVVLVDPPYGLGKTYAGRRESTSFGEWVREVVAWSRAPWTMLLAPLPTMRDWLPLVPQPTRILWWCKTFAQIRKSGTWQHAVTPVLVYMAPDAPWHYPRGVIPDFIVCASSMPDWRILRHHLEGASHPGITGTPIASELLAPVSRPGDLVVDPMCGTGSILVAAHRLGRRVWGCEVEAKYLRAARSWLAAEGCPN